MKKWLLGVGLLILPTLLIADGNYQPVLSPNTTGGNYSYPNAPAPASGGVLVNNSGTLFNWSNAVVGTTTSLTATQFPALPLLTLAQIQALTPYTTGQIVMCTNCTQSPICVSTQSVTQGGWVVASGTATVSQGLLSCK